MIWIAFVLALIFFIWLIEEDFHRQRNRRFRVLYEDGRSTHRFLSLEEARGLQDVFGGQVIEVDPNNGYRDIGSV